MLVTALNTHIGYYKVCYGLIKTHLSALLKYRHLL